MSEPCDYGIPDSELTEMSIVERNALLARLNEDFAVTYPECSVTKGDHDWSEEGIDPRNPDSETVVACAACGRLAPDGVPGGHY